MFVFSFRGLGFLVPAVIFAPVSICILALSRLPDVQLMTTLITSGIVALISAAITYGLGKHMNRNGVKHAFGEIRFEHWGIIQFSGFGLVISLILLNVLVEYIESILPFGSWLQQNIFLFYLAILITSPISLFIYIRQKMRALNSDLNDA